MSFDNAKFEKNAKETMSTLEKLKEKLNFEGAVKGFGKLEDSIDDLSFDELNGGIEKTSSKFSALEAVAIGALMNIGSQIESTAQKLVSSLTIDQISAGWSKYEQKTSSVQTIMNSTGKSMEEVNEQLDKLNWYTDETSYNFLDMVSNIGKFTSNSVELGTAVTAMQGIANWAALSGANVNQASAAMYNLAQAISVGSVKLIDWKSIENANMATTEFKQTVIDTAVELGTLKKTTSGYATVAKGTAVSATNFNSALSEGWFSSDVLLKSLNEYGRFSEALYGAMDLVSVDTTSEMISLVEAYKDGTKSIEELSEELGRSAADTKTIMDTLSDSSMELSMKAFKAGQETKTLSEAIAYVKEAVSSGWMNTFEIIFGDYEEAKKLWSNLSETLYSVFVASGEARNKLLEGALDNSAEFVTKDDWVGLTEGLDITEDLQNGIIAYAKESGVAIDDLISQYGTFEKSLKDGWLTSDLFTNYVVELLNSTDEESEALKDFATNIDDTSSSLSELVDKLNRKSGRTLLLDSIQNSFDAACKVVEAFKDAISDVFPAVTSENIYNVIERVNEFTESLIASDGVVSKFKNTFKGILSVIRTVGEIFVSFIRVAAKGAEAFEGIGEVVLSVFNLIGSLVSSMNDAVSETGAFTSVGQLLYGIVAKLVTIFNNFAKSVANVIDYISKSTVIKKFANTAKTVGNAFVTIVSGIERAIFGVSVIAGEASESIYSFSGAMEHTSTIGDGIIKVINKLLDGINAVFTKVKNSQAITNISNAFVELKAALKPLVTSIVNLFKTVGTAFTSLFSAITGKTDITDIIADILETAINGIATLIGWITALITTVNQSGIFETIGGGIAYIFQSIRDGITGSTENSGFLSNIFSQLSKFSDFLADTASDIKSLNLFDLIKTGLGNMISAFNNLDNSVANTLKPAIESIRDLLGGDEALFNIIGLAEIYYLVKAITSLVGQFKSLSKVTDALASMMKSFGTAAKGFADAAKWQALSEMLKSFGIAVGIVAVSIFALSFVDTGKLIGAAVAVGAIAAALAYLIKSFSKITTTTKDLPSAATIIAFAAALDMLVIPVLVFSLIPWQKLAVGGAGVAAMLVALGAAARVMGKGAKGATVILAMAVALNALVIPIKVLSKIDAEALKLSVTALAGLLMVMALSAPTVAPALGTLSKSLLEFAASVALIAISVPVSILLFVAAIEKLSSIKVTANGVVSVIVSVVVGLGLLAATLTALYFAAPYITPILPLFEKLSKAIKNMAIGIAGLAVVSLLISGFTDEIGLALTELITTMCKIIINTAPYVTEAVLTVIDALLISLANHAESIATSLVKIIYAILSVVFSLCGEEFDETWTPFFVQKGEDIGNAIIEGIKETFNVENLMNAVKEAFSGWKENIANEIGFWKTGALTPGMTFAKDENDVIYTTESKQYDTFAETVKERIKEFGVLLDTTLQTIGRPGKWVGQSENGTYYMADNIIKKKLSDNEKEAYNSGEAFDQGFANGITDNSDVVSDAAEDVGDKSKEAVDQSLDINSPSKETYKTGIYFVQGLANGINDNTNLVTDSTDALGSIILTTLANKLGIHSPSAEAFAYGDMVDQGLANGINDNSGVVDTSASNLADSVTDSLDETGTEIGETTGDTITESMSSEIESNSQDVTDAGLMVIEDSEVPLTSAATTVATNVADSAIAAAISRIKEGGSSGFYQAWRTGINSLGLNKTKTTDILPTALVQDLSSSLKTPDPITAAISNIDTSAFGKLKSVFSGLATDVAETLGVSDVTNLLSGNSEDVDDWISSLTESLTSGISSAASSATSSSTSSSTTKNAIVKLGYANGEYYVEGLTSGITDSMNSEEIIEKKASNIQTAFNKEIDKLDLSETASDLDYELWANLYEDTADAQELYAKKTAKISKKIDAQTKKMNFYQAEYNMMIKQFGEESKQAQQAYNDMIQAQIDLNSLNDELKQTNLIVYDKLTEGYENDITSLTSKSKTLDAEEQYLEAIYGNSAIDASKKFTEAEYYAKKYVNSLQQVNVLQKEYNNYKSEDYKNAFLEAGGTELEYAQLLEESYQNLLSAKTDFVNDWNDIGDTLEWPKWFVALGSNISSVIADNTDNTVAISKISGTLEKVSGKITGVLGKYIGEDTVTSITNGIKQFIDEDGADVLTDATTAIWSFYKGDVAAGITGTFQFVGDLSGTALGQNLLSAVKTKLLGSDGLVSNLKSIFSGISTDSGILSTLWDAGTSFGSKLLSGVTNLFSGSQNGGLISTVTSLGSNLLSTFTGSSGVVSTVVSGVSTIGTKIAGVAATAGSSLASVGAAIAPALGPVAIGAACVGVGIALDKYVTSPIRDKLSEAADTAEEKGETIKSGILNIGSGMTQIANPISFIKGLFTGDTWEAYGNIWKGLGQTISGVASGIGNAASKVVSAAKSAASKAISGVKNFVSDSVEAGSNLVSGIAEGIKNTATAAVTAVKNVGSKIVSGFKSLLGIHSPSTVMAGLAEFLNMGLAEGLNSTASLAINAATSVGGGIYTAVSGALDSTSALANDSLDYEPTITPVVDLGNLQSSVGSALATAADLNLNKAFDDQLYQLGDITINNNDVVDAIDELSSKFDTLREAITNMKLVTDTGALVGQIIDSVDGSLGQLVGYAERGI
jgi:phage-related protein